MLSRVANSIYWISRYIERAENYGRFINVNIGLSLDAPGLFTENWGPILTATADHFAFFQYYEQATRENVIDFMTFDLRNPNSIYSSLAAARENARTIREVLPHELWVQINAFYLKIKAIAASSNRTIDDPQAFFDDVRQGCQLFWGMLDSAYTRNEGYHFASLGKFIERADKTSRFLDVNYFTPSLNLKKGGASPEELLIWTSVLKSVSAFNMYRQQYKNLEPMHIVKFLVLDKCFPRSIYYSVLMAEVSLYKISGQSLKEGFSNLAEKKVSILRNELSFTEIEDFYPKNLHEFLDTFQKKNNEVDNGIFKTYFELKPTKQTQLQLS